MMPDCKLDVTGAPVIASSALFPVTVKYKTIVADSSLAIEGIAVGLFRNGDAL